MMPTTLSRSNLRDARNSVSYFSNPAVTSTSLSRAHTRYGTTSSSVPMLNHTRTGTFGPKQNGKRLSVTIEQLEPTGSNRSSRRGTEVRNHQRIKTEGDDKKRNRVSTWFQRDKGMRRKERASMSAFFERPETAPPATSSTTFGPTSMTAPRFDPHANSSDRVEVDDQNKTVL